jgi:hypothetical protein
MPQMEVEVSCPGCDAVFSVPVELCGEMAECTECAAVFEIPGVSEVPPTLNTDTGAIKGIPPPASADNAVIATNTIKLSRVSIGMIPTLKESFNLGQNSYAEPDSEPSFTEAYQQQLNAPIQQKSAFVKSSSPPSPPPAKPVPAPAHTTAFQHSASRTFSTQTSTALSAQQIAQAVKLPPWTNIQLKQGEELQTCREIKKNPTPTAVLASLPVLLTICAMFFAKTQLGLAVGLVVVLWIVTFIIALLVTKDSSKRAIVITNQRTICIIGKDSIELKK